MALLHFRDLFLEVTGACDLACRHCFRAGGGGAHVPATLVLERAASVRSDNVVVTGGEPLLHPELGRIMGGLRGMGRSVILITNGSSLAENASLVLSLADVVNVSLDWPDERHGANRGRADLHERVAEGLERLREGRGPGQRPRLNLLTTMFRENAQSYADVMRFAARHGADRVVFDRYVPYHEPPTMLDPAILRSSLESILSAQGGAEPVFYEPFHWVLHGGGTPRFRCKQRVFCGADGRYKPCPFYPRSFATAREVAAERAGEPLPRKCEGCEHAETCHGGCPATRLVVRGSLSERDPLCPLAEGRP